MILNNYCFKVKALIDCMHEMRSRAEQANMILLGITTDADKLHLVNSHVEETAETFHNLSDLMDAVHELEKELKQGEFDYYSVIADLLVDVQNHMAKFKQYVAIPQISLISQKVNAIESELKRQVQWSFREIGALASSERYEHEDPSSVMWSVDISSLNQAYLVVDALGEKCRKDLLERFSQIQLLPYTKLFQHGSKYAGLDCMDQRFAWFRFLLGLIDEKLHDIFPSKWQVPYHLFLEFSRRTKHHLEEILADEEKEDHDPTARIQFLLKTIQSVVAFESEITASFITRDRMDANKDVNTYEIPESIRDAFDPYLGTYVQLERQGLEQLMESAMSEEEAPVMTHVNQGAPLPLYTASEPYESSLKIFEYIKKSLQRCTNFSTGVTFLSLSKEFRACLQLYSQRLKFRSPAPLVAARNGKPAIYQINKLTEATLCRIICTGEFCIDTIPALETIMKQRIQEQYRNDVDFQPQIDMFMDTVSNSINILVAGEILRMDEDFQKMKKINWGILDHVEDVGYYTKHMLKILNDCVPRIRTTMSTAYFLNVCTKLMSIFLDSFLDTIWQLKRISKTGGGQLLLDLNGMKEYLMKMPNAKLPEGTNPININKVYQTALNDKVKRVENVLKLICTEESMLNEMFTILLPNATKQETDTILVLRGEKNQLQQVGNMIVDVGNKVVHSTTTATTTKNPAVSKLSKGAEEAVENLSTGFNKVSEGFKNIFSGFNAMEHSNHSDDSNHKKGKVVGGIVSTPAATGSATANPTPGKPNVKR